MQPHKIIDDNFRLHASRVPSVTEGMMVVERDSHSYIDSGLSCDTFNVIHVKNGELLSTADLAKTLSYYRDQRKEYCLWTSYENLNAQLQQSFRELGLNVSGEEIGMSMELSYYQTSENDQFSHIVQVQSPETLADFAFVIASNWEPMDQNIISYYNRASAYYLNESNGITLLVYYHEGQPAGSVEIFPTDENTVGIYGLATLRQFRRLGIGSALMTMALNLAKELEYKHVILQATEDGIGIYKKLGFHEVTKYYEYA